MNRIGKSIIEGLGRSDVVDESSDRHDLTLVASFLPTSEDGGDEVSLEVTVKHLREEVNVGDECTHKDYGHVGGVEESDWVRGI